MPTATTYTIALPSGVIIRGVSASLTLTPNGTPPVGEQFIYSVPGVSTSPQVMTTGGNSTSITFPAAGTIPIYANTFPTGLADPYNASNPLRVTVCLANDFEGILYGILFNLQLQGVTAYNAAIDAGTLTGCKKVAVNQVFDDRPAGSSFPGRTAEKITGRAPADYPQIRLQITGGSRLPTPTKTFALAAGIVGTDAVRPITMTFLQTITYDTVKDSGQTPLESYIDSYIDGAYPKLGLRYCRDYECSVRRSDEKIKDAMRTVRRNAITVRLWPHLSDL